jgi:hypothetical protein
MKRVITNLSFLFIVATVLLASVISSYSLTRPTEFRGEGTLQGGNVNIHFYFNYDNLDNIAGVKLYQAPGKTEDLTLYTMVAEIPKDSIFSVQGMMRNFYYSAALVPGDYSFFIKAYKDTLLSERSNIAYMSFLPPPATIRFLNALPAFAYKGMLFTFDVNAVASDSSEVHYKLQNAPNGMVIDSLTGVITWTPAEGGSFHGAVIAYLPNRPEVSKSLEFNIYVYKCDNRPRIIGTVQFDDGTTVNDGTASVTYIGQNNIGFPKDALTTKIVNGQFTLTLDQGDFMLVCEGAAFQPKWYQNANNMQQADTIHLICGDTLLVTLQVTPRGNPENHIVFVSNPVLTGHINQLYTYDVNARKSSQGDSNDVGIHYLLVNHPDGMTIDSITGIISWTPTVAGQYKVVVSAYLSGTVAYVNKLQDWTITAFTCPEGSLPHIIGTVKDGDNNPVANGQIWVYKADQNEPLLKQPFTQGSFNIAVDQGTYLVFFQGERYTSEWYQNATVRDSATSFTILCGDSIIINMQVQKVQLPGSYTVGGNVMRAANNQPVPYAMVEFFGKKTNNNEPHIFRTFSNIEGHYNIDLSDQFQYIAFCHVVDSLNVTPLLSQYYNNQTDPTLADVITLTGNMDGVNFNLQDKPNYDNSITGIVQNPDNQRLTNVFLIAYLVEAGAWNNDYLYIGRTTEADSTGSFMFTNLLPGKYVIFAYPVITDSVVPGYYRDSTQAVFNWQEATKITVTDAGNAANITFTLRKFTRLLAHHGRLHGFMHRRGKSILKSDNATLDMAPVIGASAFIINNEGNAINYTMTDKNGEYTIESLPQGTNRLVIDKIGLDKYQADFTLQDDNSTVENPDLILETTTGVDDGNIGSNEISVYPNPATNFVNVNFNGITPVSIKLINAMGGQVISLAAGEISDSGSMCIPLNSISTGAYYLIITGTNGNTFIPLVIVK